jgi:hypothetical protein
MPATPEVLNASTSSANPFACFIDADGNIWAGPGVVIAIQGSTDTFDVGGPGRVMADAGAFDDFQPAAETVAQFMGGNGTNLIAESGSALAAVMPFDRFRAVAPNVWACEGCPELTITWDPADGAAIMEDGDDIVATAAAGTPVPRSASFVATTYGEDTYNGGSPFDLFISYEGAADPWPPRNASVVWGDAATAQGGEFVRTGWQSWVSDEDPDWTLELDGSGAGEISDATDVVATRAADASRLYNPAGEWVPTAYGLATYGAPVPVYTATASAGTWPTQTYAYYSELGGGFQLWLGESDPTKFLVWEASFGGGYLGDAGTDIQAETGEVAMADTASTSGFTGGYTATTEGRATYNGGDPFNIVVAESTAGRPFLGQSTFLRGTPAAGVVYASLALDSAQQVTSVSPPLLAATLPANTSGEVHFPIVESDGLGGIVQRQLGPILWQPPQPGPAGTGLTWVSLTAAAYAALGTPDPDTIYDITDYP